MAHTFTRLRYHLIWSTKHRHPFIDPSLKPKLHAYLTGIAASLKAKALIGNGTTDHVHLRLSLPAPLAIAEAGRVRKANSAGWIHQEWPERASFAWQAKCDASRLPTADAVGCHSAALRG